MTAKALLAAVLLPVLYLADVEPDATLGLTLGRDARAFVGAPLTPYSMAGVARRTTRRVVLAETATVEAAARPAGAPALGTVANALRTGCVPEDKGGIECQRCGGVYYRSAFQGNNLVYVVQAT
jgi:hypothetical protein